jgi:hypothetical protein
MQEAQVAAGKLIKARKDTTKMLDLVDKTLYQMAFTVQPSIVMAGLFAALVGWDHGFSTSLKHKVDKVLACIGPVCNHMLTSKALSHFKGLGAVVALSSGQAHSQGIAQAIGTDMDLGAETTPTAPQRLVSLFASFFERLLRTDERALSYYPTERFPYPGLGQNAQTSLATPPPHTNAKNVCKDYSSSRMHLVLVATVLHFAVSTAPLLQSVGTFVLTLSRCLCILADITRFSAIARQLVVLSCGYYATNVNTS